MGEVIYVAAGGFDPGTAVLGLSLRVGILAVDTEFLVLPSTARAAVLEGVPSNPGRPRAFVVSLESAEGIPAVAELDYGDENGLEIRAAAYGYSNRISAAGRGPFGAYAMAEQRFGPAATPWLRLQPDFQIAWNPGGLETTGTAYVGGFRVTLTN